ncbi:MAG: hypothetical protein WC861_05815 [Candidatus Micrarchaeia archaeon]
MRHVARRIRAATALLERSPGEWRTNSQRNLSALEYRDSNAMKKVRVNVEARDRVYA